MPTVTIIEHVVRAQPSGIQWGDMATWTASILTGASLLLALALFWQQRRKEEQALANELVVWSDAGYRFERVYNPPYPYAVHIRNHTVYPFFQAVVQFKPRKWRKFEADAPRLHGLLEAARQADPELHDVFAQTRSITMPEHDAWRDFSIGTTVIQPGMELDKDIELAMPAMAYDIDLYFSDAQSRRWRRNLVTGRMRRHYGMKVNLLWLQNKVRRFLRRHRLAWLIGERSQ